MKVITEYEAFDGKRFKDENLCKRYEETFLCGHELVFFDTNWEEIPLESKDSFARAYYIFIKSFFGMNKLEEITGQGICIPKPNCFPHLAEWNEEAVDWTDYIDKLRKNHDEYERYKRMRAEYPEMPKI